MQFTASTPRLARSFQDLPISVPAPITEGFICSADAAHWTNSQLATVTGNAFGGLIRRELDKINKERETAVKAKNYTGPTEEITKNGKVHLVPAKAVPSDILVTKDGTTSPMDFQAEFDAIYAAYEMVPSNRTSGTSTPKDATAALARSFAEVDLVARIQSKGLTPAKFRAVKMEDGRTKFTHLLDAQYTSKADEYMARARADMEAAEANAAADDFDLSLDTDIKQAA